MQLSTFEDRALTVDVRITGDELAKCMPNCPAPEVWAHAMNVALEYCNADPALFIAQIGHESMSLTRLEENLYYSWNRLRRVWPSRFHDKAVAKAHARNPEKLANAVYGGRLGNTQPGDGWRYRGRGPIMLTGRANYAACERDTGLPVTSRPELVASDPVVGMRTAAWYWIVNVSGSTIEETTEEINGGDNGLSDRLRRYDVARRVLSGRYNNR